MDNRSPASRPEGLSHPRKRPGLWAAVILVLPALLAVVAPASASPETVRNRPRPAHTILTRAAVYQVSRALTGTASWYGGRHVGRTTAIGEIHSSEMRTAAHRSLPFGTLVKVTNLKNGRTTTVRVNDRGPYVPGRSIDLSELAARDLAMLDGGLAPVRMEIMHERRR